MTTAFLCSSALLIAGANGFAAQETTMPGQQRMNAHRTSRPIIIDGRLGPAEWSAAIPVHVNAVKPGSAPGVVPSIEGFPFLVPPDNQDDSSFTVRALYDDNNLYVAITVADDALFALHPLPYLWLDDDVELLIDGDRQPLDFAAGLVDIEQNQEGFQLITSVGGGRQTEPPNNPDIQTWNSAVGPAPRGYVVEYVVPLGMINTHDTSYWTGGTPGYRPPQPGDEIGFNVSVGDNDTGFGGYLVGGDQSNSYTAWDGSSLGWWILSEQDWGTLYLVP